MDGANRQQTGSQAQARRGAIGATAVVRSAVADDLDALVALINRAYHVESFFVRGLRTNQDDVRERMGRPGARFLVIDGPGMHPRVLLAAVFVEVRGDRGFFAMLSVDPEHQKQGLARRLLAEAEVLCRAAGCRFLDLDVVNLRVELPGFYQALGFAPFATAPFDDPAKLLRPASVVLMTKPLVELWG